MYSFLMVENRTKIPAITIYGSDGVIFRDILINEKTKPKQLPPGSLGIKIYDNFMKEVTSLWVPLVPYQSVSLIVYDDYISIIPKESDEAF